MRISADEMMAAMSGVSEQLITESMKGSKTIRERFILRISTAAAAVVLVLAAGIFTVMYAGGGSITPPANTLPAETEAESIEAGEHTTRATLDGEEIVIVWTADESGEITGVEVTSDGVDVALSDTQGKYYRKMLLFVDGAFYVECDIVTGEIDDFMREARYDYFNENDAKTWESIRDVSTVRGFRYDDSGVFFIAVTMPSDTSAGQDALRGLWAYDHNDAELTRANVEWEQIIWIEPKNGSWESSSGDGGVYFVTSDGWDYGVGFENLRGISDWFPELGIKHTVEPDDPDYNFEAKVEFDMDGRHYEHWIYLLTDDLTTVASTCVVRGEIDGVEIAISWTVRTGKSLEAVEITVPDDAPNMDKWRFEGRAGDHTVAVTLYGDDAGIWLFDLETAEATQVHVGEQLKSFGVNIGDDVLAVDVSGDFSGMIVLANRNYDPIDAYFIDLLSPEMTCVSVRELPTVAELIGQLADKYGYVMCYGTLGDDASEVLITLRMYESLDAMNNGDLGAEVKFIYYPDEGHADLWDFKSYEDVESGGTPQVIKESYAALVLGDAGAVDYVTIYRYYGCFDGVYVASVMAAGQTYPAGSDAEVIDGVEITYSSEIYPLVFDGEGVYRLSEAYEKGLLTHDDLLTIAERC